MRFRRGIDVVIEVGDFLTELFSKGLQNSLVRRLDGLQQTMEVLLELVDVSVAILDLQMVLNELDQVDRQLFQNGCSCGLLVTDDSQKNEYRIIDKFINLIIAGSALLSKLDN